MVSTINDQGFNRQRYQELRKSIAQDFASDGLPDVTNNLQSVPGRIVSQVASLQERNDAYVQAILDAMNPYAASGVQLDRLAPMMGKRRNPASRSSGMITVTAGADGVTIPAGSMVSDGKNKVRTKSDAIVPPSGAIDIAAEAVEYGAIEFKPSTLTIIDTPIYGWVSVTNNSAFITGSERETDSQLRFRILKSQSIASASTLGIYTAVSEVDGVSYVYVDDNKTNQKNERGLAPHSVFVVVAGGDDDAIADALLRNVAAGIETQQSIPGASITTKRPVNPANKQQVPISFCRPSDVAMKCTIRIQEDPKLPPDYEARIKSEVIKWFEGREIGQKIIASRLYSPVNNVEGFEINGIQVGKKSPGSLHNEVALQPFERPTILASDITVSVE